jgi:NDP-sugar pyrophosphorylase family protein/aminoglycoside/choline kinase family phosphotransferase
MGNEMKLAKIRTAFILGAGLGTRLRPLTEKLPKPLLPVGGRPLITYAMDHCLSIGIGRFIVNTHHCAEAYDNAFPGWSRRGMPILFRHEPVLLDTAGGLKNIEDLLEDDETILVYNGDILSNLPLSQLVAAHAAGGREVTLALRSDGPLRNVCLDARGEICDLRDLLGNPGVRRCLFTGIFIVERRFLRRLLPGKVESTIPVFAEMIREAPGSVASVVIDEGSWEDVGDITAYERIKAGGLRLRYECAAESAGGNVTPNSLVSAAGTSSGGERPRRFAGPVPGSQVESENSFFPTISGSPLETADSSAHPRTVAPEDVGGVTTAALSTGERKETGPQVSDFIREMLGLAAGERVELAPVGNGGSDRDFFRVAAAGVRPVILMCYGRFCEENDLYAAVASFLRGIDVSVPTIVGHDPERRLILMEDLGDTDLYALRNAPWEVRRGLYEKVLALAAKMHAFSPDRLPAGLRLMPGFDAELYRWERDYFREECVRNVCRIDLGDAGNDALETELSALAERLLSTNPVLVHRDLQSQNVMIRDGKPVLIDFQGMRPGSPFYDLGSLLYDPYVPFPEGEREELLRFYHEASGALHPWEAFRELFLMASAQRLMQALGAYGFLGLKRGKPHFLAHIRPALENLIVVTAETGSLPHLNALARRCREAVGKGIEPAA